MKGRYYSLNEYLQSEFGEKVYKLALDLGVTCPNRDGRLDTRGCIFCLAGSSHFAAAEGDINQKIDKAKALVANKTKANRFIAYFQSYTNTYAPIEFLRQSFFAAASRADIAAISIATRPDCLGAEVLDLLSEINAIKPLWIELGLQTSNAESAKYIRRCYENDVYIAAVAELKKRNITVITHIILGLPNESEADMLNSVKFAVTAGTDGIKLQLLHILQGTDLATDYQKGNFSTLSLEEYTQILFECLKIIPPEIVVHRLTGDAPKKHLIAPLWSGDKKRVINYINRQMEEQNIVQGSGRE
ncbi:MAG: TIGR01212 family radical SAM protein [Clostridia bacterium]|nr:TIGR01212 family radical SAM protein [Clostridia bacterium]